MSGHSSSSSSSSSSSNNQIKNPVNDPNYDPYLEKYYPFSERGEPELGESVSNAQWLKTYYDAPPMWSFYPAHCCISINGRPILQGRRKIENVFEQVATLAMIIHASYSVMIEVSADFLPEEEEEEEKEEEVHRLQHAAARSMSARASSRSVSARASRSVSARSARRCGSPERAPPRFASTSAFARARSPIKKSKRRFYTAEELLHIVLCVFKRAPYGKGFDYKPMYHQTLPAGAAAAAETAFAPHAALGILAYIDDPKITLKSFITKKTFRISDYDDITVAQQKQHMQRLFDLFAEMKKIWKIKSIDINIIIDITSHTYITLIRDAIAKARGVRPSTRTTTTGAEKSSATD